MSDVAASSFVRQELVPARAAPIKTTGFVGFLRTRLFNSPTNILLTLASIILLWLTVIPAIKFLLVDAVWHGTDRNACLAENAGHVVGACWPYVQAKFFPVHLRLLPRTRTLAGQSDFPAGRAIVAATVDSATASQKPECRAVFCGVSHRCVLLAAWWRVGRLRYQLDRQRVVGICGQHRRCRPQGGERGRDNGHRGPAAAGVRQADRAVQHRRFLCCLAADLASRPNPGVGRPLWTGLRGDDGHCFDPVVCAERWGSYGDGDR